MNFEKVLPPYTLSHLETADQFEARQNVQRSNIFCVREESHRSFQQPILLIPD